MARFTRKIIGPILSRFPCIAVNERLATNLAHRSNERAHVCGHIKNTESVTAFFQCGVGASWLQYYVAQDEFYISRLLRCENVLVQHAVLFNV